MRMQRLSKWEKWSVLVWLAFGVVNGSQVVVGMRASGMHHLWGPLFAVYALSWVPWAIASPFILRLGVQYPPRRHWRLHLVTYLAIGTIDAAWMFLLKTHFHPMGVQHFGLTESIFSFFYSKFHLDLLAYAGVLAIGHMLHTSDTLAQRDQQLAEVRLDALRRQLQPHFLFNTLNGIAGLVRIGQQETAVEMIARLGSLLRRVIDGTERMVPLSEEIAFVQEYLELQRMRLGDRLQVTMTIPPDAGSVRVPSMILQPLVENALEHGIARSVEGGELSISAEYSDSRLLIIVENDGGLVAGAQENVGLTNTRARLRDLYGDAGFLDLQTREGGKVTATLRLGSAHV
jgi:hypothetical protein